MRAYEHLSQFEGRAKFSTWLTKIAIYEAYARVRRFDYRNVDSVSNLEDQGMDLKSKEHDPEQQTFDDEMRMLLERALDAIPDDYRSIFMLREIEGLSTAETAECLEISEENVKTRLHRARTLFQREFYSAAGTTATTATGKRDSLPNKTRGGIDRGVGRDDPQSDCAERYQPGIHGQWRCQRILTAVSTAGEQDPPTFPPSHRSEEGLGYTGRELCLTAPAISTRTPDCRGTGSHWILVNRLALF